MKALLSEEIQREYSRLMELVGTLPLSIRILKEINGTGGMVSVADLVAYQIGWGKCLIRQWISTR